MELTGPVVLQLPGRLERCELPRESSWTLPPSASWASCPKGGASRRAALTVKTRLDQLAAVCTLRNAGNVTVNCIMRPQRFAARALRVSFASKSIHAVLALRAYRT